MGGQMLIAQAAQPARSTKSEHAYPWGFVGEQPIERGNLMAMKRQHVCRRRRGNGCTCGGNLLERTANAVDGGVAQC